VISATNIRSNEAVDQIILNHRSEKCESITSAVPIDQAAAAALALHDILFAFLLDWGGASFAASRAKRDDLIT